MKDINLNMFRAYDIRGIFGEGLTVEIMLNIGRALGTFLKRKGGERLTIGGDIRSSTEILHHSFVAGVTSIGIDCEIVGKSPLGITLFNSYIKEYDASAFVTASHLPPEWNGVKFYWGEGIGFSPEENEEIKNIFIKSDFDEVGAFEVGKITKVDPQVEYENYLKTKFNFEKTFKIAVDCGNGATSLVLPEMYERLGMKVISLFADPDPTFPNRSSEPNEETLTRLAELVKKETVDFAAGFDGDGDRCVFVDEKGNILSSDAFGVIIADFLMKTVENNRVLINMECSIAMENYLRNIGADLTRIRVGHSFLSLEAKKRDAVWGVEASGHAIAPHIFLFDDALILPFLMASAVEYFDKPVSELAQQVKLPVKKRIDLMCPDERKFDAVAEIAQYFAGEPGEINDLDGVSLTNEIGRILVRASNTSPKVRVNIESMTQEGFDTLRDRYLEKIKQYI